MLGAVIIWSFVSYLVIGAVLTYLARASSREYCAEHEGSQTWVFWVHVVWAALTWPLSIEREE